MPGCTNLIPEVKQNNFELIAGKHKFPTCIVLYFCSILKCEL